MRVALVGLVLSASVAAHAEPAALTYDLWIDVPLTAVATSAWLGTELLKPALAPNTCRWCDEDLNPLDQSVRETLRWSDPAAGDLASNIAVISALPASAGVLALAGGIDGARADIAVDMLLVAEATMVAAALNQGAKFTFGRERPFVRALPAHEKRLTQHPDDNNLSFYSGHANLTFALAASSGTVATMRGYRFAPAVWVAGLTAATAASYFRIAGDRHYFTDVLVGAAAGSAIGAGLPLLFHRPHAPTLPVSLSVAPMDGGGFVLLSGTLSDGVSRASQ